MMYCILFSINDGEFIVILMWFFNLDNEIFILFKSFVGLFIYKE